MNNKVFKKPTTLIIGLIMIGLLSVSYASVKAEGDYPSIVQKIAERFNLNEADVQAVFDEEKQEHFADIQARWNEKLDDLVNNGQITSKQKEEIIKKHEEMHNQMLELKDMQPKQRREEMKKIHEDFKNWAEEQEIDLTILGPIKFRHRNGMGMGKMMFHDKIQ